MDGPAGISIEQLLKVQRDLAVALSGSLEFQAALELCLKTAIDVSGMDGGGIYLVDADSGELKLASHQGLSDAFIELVSHYPPDSPNTKLVMAGKPLYARYQDLVVPVDESENIRSLAVVPVLHESIVIAALNLASLSSEEIPDFARYAAETIAAQIGSALARIRTEGNLRESEERFRMLFEYAPDGYYLLDLTGRFVDGNRLAERIVGHPRDELIGRNFIEAGLLPEEYYTLALDNMSKNIAGQPTGPDEYELIRKDKTRIPVEITTIPVTIHGKGLVLGIARDITARKQAREEKRQLEEQLLQAQKMEAVGTLAGGVAHDFNNLLTGILGNADLIRRRTGPEQQIHKAARTIEIAADRAAQLTEQLIGFARKGKYDVQPVNANNLIFEVTELLERTIDKSISIDSQIGTETAVIAGDRNQLLQVLMNLAINARDAMPSGGKLTFRTETVELGEDYCQSHMGATPGSYLMIVVQDCGTGMSEEVRQRAFEPFFTTKPKDKGSGMGLAMAYGIIKNHGGHIDLESQPGQGTTFRMFLPLSEDQQEQVASQPSQEVTRGTGTILVVDDEEIVSSTACLLLGDLGYQTIEMSNGPDAVDYYRRHHQDIDLVIVDLIMPQMSGSECFRELKKINPDIKAILSTGYGEDQRIQEMFDLGIMGFIQKPFQASQLSKTVAAILGP